jgi:hypothetical protein
MSIVLCCCVFSLASLFAIWVLYFGGDNSLVAGLGAIIWLGLMAIVTGRFFGPLEEPEPSSARMIVGFS